MVPTKRSAIALVRGARTGVLMTWTSMAVSTASNAAVRPSISLWKQTITPAPETLLI